MNVPGHWLLCDAHPESELKAQLDRIESKLGGVSRPGDYEHLLRVADALGWRKSEHPESDHVVRFSSGDGDPTHYVDFSIAMEPLMMAEALTRAAMMLRA